MPQEQQIFREIRPVEVRDVLRARDDRVSRQNAFLKKHASPLISFTMNIAGSIKYDAEIYRAFREGVSRIRRQLERLNIEPLEYAETVEFTGCEALWAVRGDAAVIKAKMCMIEEADALGRLFDIDVIDADGSHLTRASERTCLICGGSVRACARSRAHSAQELYRKARSIIREYFDLRFARKVGELAQRALLYEAVTTPKPGLVDCEDSGAHRDMDLFSFVSSGCALRSYFERCVRIGMDGGEFERLQYAGLQAEDDMIAAAKVNTHKGAIFSLGILCCAVGSCGEHAEMETVLKRAAELGEASLAELKLSKQATTGGERQFWEYGLTGARGEAASGFRTVSTIALPALDKALAEGKRLDEAGLYALISLMARVQDSNVIRRAGMEGQRWVNDCSEQLLQQDFGKSELRELNRAFIERNVSPGGSADLLAAAYFLHFFMEENEKQRDEYS